MINLGMNDCDNLDWPGKSQCLPPPCVTNADLWLLVMPLPCLPNPHSSSCLHLQTNGDFHSGVAGCNRECAYVSPPGA